MAFGKITHVNIETEDVSSQPKLSFLRGSPIAMFDDWRVTSASGHGVSRSSFPADCKKLSVSAALPVVSALWWGALAQLFWLDETIETRHPVTSESSTDHTFQYFSSQISVWECLGLDPGSGSSLWWWTSCVRIEGMTSSRLFALCHKHRKCKQSAEKAMRTVRVKLPRFFFSSGSFTPCDVITLITASLDCTQNSRCPYFGKVWMFGSCVLSNSDSVKNGFWLFIEFENI